METCERCDKPATTIVGTGDSVTDETNVCEECANIITRPGTGWHRVIKFDIVMLPPSFKFGKREDTNSCR